MKSIKIAIKKYRVLTIAVFSLLIFFTFTYKANAQGVWDLLLGNVDGFFTGVAIGLSTFLLTIAGVALKIAGIVLNLSIKWTVFDMSKFIDTQGIKEAWAFIRDLANIGFIFGIAYIAIATILQITGRGIRELLIKLIIAALLVNFSFFFTSVLIDTSNILTMQIYQRIDGIGGLQSNQSLALYGDVPPTDPNYFDSIASVGISGVFLYHSGVISIFQTYGSTPGSELNTGVVTAMGFFGTLFISILVIAFLVMAALLLVRLVVLMVLVMTSPIAYLGSAFPGLRNASNQWWSSLWSQLIFAPAFMIMIMAIVLVLGGVTSSSGATGSGSSVSGPIAALFGTNTAGGPTFFSAISTGFEDPDMVTVILNYAVVIGLAVTAIILPKKIASQAGGAISTAVGKASAYAAGSVGWAGRQSLGRAGSAIVDNERLAKYARSGRVGSGFAKTIRFTGDAAQKTSFDFRATGLGKSAGLGNATGKGGRKQVLDDYAKKKDQRAELMGELSDKEILNRPEYKSRATTLSDVQKIKRENTEAIKDRKSKLEKAYEDEDSDAAERLISEVESLEKEGERLTKNEGVEEAKLRDLQKNLKFKAQEEYAKKLGRGGWGNIIKKRAIPTALGAIIGGVTLGPVGAVAGGVAAGGARIGSDAGRAAKRKISKRIKSSDEKKLFEKFKKSIEDEAKESEKKDDTEEGEETKAA